MSTTISRDNAFFKLDGGYDICDSKQLRSYIKYEGKEMSSTLQGHRYLVIESKSGAIVYPGGDKAKAVFVAFYEAGSRVEQQGKDRAGNLKYRIETKGYTGKQLQIATRLYLEAVATIENDKEHKDMTFIVINATLGQVRGYKGSDSQTERKRYTGFKFEVSGDLMKDMRRLVLPESGQKPEVDKVPPPPVSGKKKKKKKAEPTETSLRKPTGGSPGSPSVDDPRNKGKDKVDDGESLEEALDAIPSASNDDWFPDEHEMASAQKEGRRPHLPTNWKPGVLSAAKTMAVGVNYLLPTNHQINLNRFENAGSTKSGTQPPPGGLDEID